MIHKNSLKIIPIGYSALIEQYKLCVIPHYRSSYIALQGRGYVTRDNHNERHIYPKDYRLKDPDHPFQQLEFAIKYDGINLEILKKVFQKINKNELETAIIKHPTSKYSRIIWFLFEFLTDTQLDVPEISNIKYIDVLDSKRYFTAPSKRSKRHRINNNLLGNKLFCPIIRKTTKLQEHIAAKYDQKATSLAESFDPQLMIRASRYLYTKETMSSYAIEHEKPSSDRINRFVELLQKANLIDTLTKDTLIKLQNSIVDPRFHDIDYRHTQNYVGENINQYLQRVHYISPKPEDLESFMQGLLDSASSLEICHPVLLASYISFGFVFIHPFEDGNGRLHRFLIHYILAKSGFTPPGIIYPISAVMLGDLRKYDSVLESFSKPLMDLITDYHLSNEGILTVNQSTRDFYPYIDYTLMAEYLFDCIQETLHTHFEKEIEFLISYDTTKQDIQNLIDMPDRLIDLLIKCVLQNQGVLSKEKRNKYFDMLSEDEISQVQLIIQQHMPALSQHH